MDAPWWKFILMDLPWWKAIIAVLFVIGGSWVAVLLALEHSRGKSNAVKAITAIGYVLGAVLCTALIVLLSLPRGG